MNIMKFATNAKECINFGIGCGNKTIGDVVTCEFLGLWIDNNWNYCEIVPVCGLTWKITIHDKHAESMITWSTGFCVSEWGWWQRVHLKCWHCIPEIDTHHHGHCFEGLTYCCLRMFSLRRWAISCNVISVDLRMWHSFTRYVVPDTVKDVVPSCSRVRRLLLRRLCRILCTVLSHLTPQLS